MSRPPRFNVLNIGVDPLGFQPAVDAIFEWIAAARRSYISLCNAYTIITAYDDPAMAKVVNEAGMSLCDGKPLVWYAHLRGYPQAQRVYGPDLMLAVCDQGQAKNTRHFLYGASQTVLDALVADLKKRYPRINIVGAISPPYRALGEPEEMEMADKINAAQPDCVWVSLGTPKQDLWIGRNRPRLNAAVLFPVGAAFDFHSGAVKQAPKWIREGGFEWLYRLLTQPRRLARRYLIHTPRFLWLLLLQHLGVKKF